MKKYVIIKIFIFTLPVILLSCGTIPFNFGSSQSWLIPQNASIKNKNTINISSVQVDRSGGWDSVEREITTLAPLYFWNNGCMIVNEEKSIFTAEIQAREREFNHGWSTKRSLAMEVRIWANDDEVENNSSSNNLSYERTYNKKLPMAVGRVVVTGEKSFASSKTTGQLLSKAIKKAVNELAIYERLKLTAVENQQNELGLEQENELISKTSEGGE